LKQEKTLFFIKIKREVTALNTKKRLQSKLIEKTFSSIDHLTYGTACQVKWLTPKQSTALKQVLIAGLAATKQIGCHSVLIPHSLVYQLQQLLLLLLIQLIVLY